MNSVVTFCVLMSGTDLSVVKSNYELFFIMRNTDKEYLHEKATPKRVIDMRNTDKEYLHEKATPKCVIDMRNTDKEYLHEKASNTLIIILTKQIVEL